MRASKQGDSNKLIRRIKINNNNKPGENTAAVARMASSPTSLEMCLKIRLNSIAFGAFVTNPLLVIAVLPSKMLLDTH